MPYREMKRKEEKMSSSKNKVKMFGPRQTLMLKYFLLGVVLATTALLMFLLTFVGIDRLLGGKGLGGLVFGGMLGLLSFLFSAIFIHDLWEERDKELFGK